MKQKTARTATKQARNGVKPRQPTTSPQAGSQKPPWGFRWHAGHFRIALWLIVAAIGIVVTFGQQEGALAQWVFRDGYVATRATVVKAPYWADALAPKPQQEEANAGWHIDLRVGDYPFTLAVGLSDFDPDRNGTDQKIIPDANRFAVGTVHPIWFYDDQHRKAPETVALLASAPALLISRAAFSRFPSLWEALENSVELLVVPACLLFIAWWYLLFSFIGRQGGNTAGSPLSVRIGPALFAFAAAGAAWLVNSEHPLASTNDQYAPAQIEITREPFPNDKLTNYRGYRVLWRTWQVEAKLDAPGGPGFTIDVDGLDPHLVPWASRHSPDFSAFKPGTKMPVWQSSYRSADLKGVVTSKPEVQWDTFLSRERWPEKYTLRDFIKDNTIPDMIIVICIALGLVWLVPLGGRRR